MTLALSKVPFKVSLSGALDDAQHRIAVLRTLLPLFVNDIAASSTGTIDQATGTVRLSGHEQTVTVQLRHAPV